MRNFYLLICFFIFCFPFAQAQQQNNLSAEERYKTAPGKSALLVVEKAYRLEVLKYLISEQSLLANAVFKMKNSTPEDVLISFFKSFVEQDYTKMRLHWTSDSIKLMDAIDQKNKIDSVARFKQISEKYAGANIYLITKILYDKYTFIEFKIKKNDTEILSDTIVLVKENDMWKITQELAGDPVVANWNTPSGRVRVPAVRSFLDVTGNASLLK